jgi:hypothetical protein
MPHDGIRIVTEEILSHYFFLMTYLWMVLHILEKAHHVPIPGKLARALLIWKCKLGIESERG